MVVILQTSITFYFIVCNVKYSIGCPRVPNSLLQQSLRADSIALSRQLSGAGLSDIARRTLPLPQATEAQSRAKEQSNGGDGSSRVEAASKANGNGTLKGPTKMHMKRNLQDTSNTFTQGSCFQGLFVKSKLCSGMLRPSVNQEASQNFEVHVPRCFPSWQASWICRKI